MPGSDVLIAIIIIAALVALGLLAWAVDRYL